MDKKDHIYKKVDSILKEKNPRSSSIGEDDLVSMVKGGITINFHIKNPTLDLENIFRTIKWTQKIIKDKLDNDLQKIDIDIYEIGSRTREIGGIVARPDTKEKPKSKVGEFSETNLVMKISK